MLSSVWLSSNLCWEVASPNCGCFFRRMRQIRKKLVSLCLKWCYFTWISLSLISQLKAPPFSFLYSSILASTSGVATLGLEPPMTPGLMEPVSWYLLRILLTQPWLTLSCLEMTQGLTPAAAISTILRRMWLGKGRPLMKTPPS